MMNATQLASALTGRQYRAETTREEEMAAAAAGLVIVFGYSDDNVELRGAIDDEVSTYNGATVYLGDAGVLSNDCDDDRCPHFLRAQAKAARFRALWCAPGTTSTWTFAVPWPHATFTVIDDGEPYCEGVVFALADALAHGPTADAARGGRDE